jgi:hypothetical protein
MRLFDLQLEATHAPHLASAHMRSVAQATENSGGAIKNDAKASPQQERANTMLIKQHAEVSVAQLKLELESMAAELYSKHMRDRRLRRQLLKVFLNCNRILTLQSVISPTHVNCCALRQPGEVCRRPSKESALPRRSRNADNALSLNTRKRRHARPTYVAA